MSQPAVAIRVTIPILRPGDLSQEPLVTAVVSRRVHEPLHDLRPGPRRDLARGGTDYDRKPDGEQ